MKQPKILLLQGANMGYLGRRQPELYGTTTAAELDEIMRRRSAELGCDVEIYYTDVEGEAIRRLYQAVDQGFDGLLMNPAGFLYAGYALRDCLRAIDLPYVEVHMTNLERRGMHSVMAAEADGLVVGLGVRSYLLGLEALLGVLTDTEE